MIKSNEIRTGDIFSEESRYVCEEINPTNIKFNHLESGKTVVLDTKYVSELLKTADQYEKQVEVGKEDKLWTAKQIADATFIGDYTRVGDVRVKGIRSIWEDITGGQVFTVCFVKQGKELSVKAYKAAKEQVVADINAKVNAAKTGKKSMRDIIEQEINNLIDNPVLSTEVGEERILRGYKIEFQSRDGRYNCIDMDIQGTYQAKVRPVNILTIKWLVYDDVKYIVEN